MSGGFFDSDEKQQDDAEGSAAGAGVALVPYDEAEHGAGVGAGRRHHRSVIETDIGEKALVAAQQGTARQGRGEFHGFDRGSADWHMSTGKRPRQ